MIFPNKVIAFEDSVVGKITVVLDSLTYAEYTVVELYNAVIDRFEDINQFLLAIDMLYILDVIEYDTMSGVLRYVEGTAM